MVHTTPRPERLSFSCNDIHFIQDRKLLSLANVTGPFTRCNPCLCEQPLLHSMHSPVDSHYCPTLLQTFLLTSQTARSLRQIKCPLSETSPACPTQTLAQLGVLWPLKASCMGLFAAFRVLHSESSPYLAANSLRTDTGLFASLPRTCVRAWSRHVISKCEVNQGIGLSSLGFPPALGPCIY